MPRDAHIPLFLWIATALLVHLLGGRGAQRAADWVEERMELERFAASVRSYVKAQHAPTIEISLGDEETPAPAPPPEETSDNEAKAKPDEQAKPKDDSPPEEDDKREDKLKETQERDAKLKKPEEKKKEPEKKVEETEKKPPEQIERRKAISVRQHVEDKNQEENPDAQFLAEHNNRVREQSQARITANDQNDPKPTPGSSASGAADQPGNAHETKIAQSEDREGEDARHASDDPASKHKNSDPTPPNAGAPDASRLRFHSAPTQTGVTAGVERPPEQNRTADKASRGSAGRAEQRAETGSPELLAQQQGAFSAPEARAPRAEQEGRRARRRRELPRPRIRGYEDFLGFGASGMTASGINLNLTPGLAKDAIGMDQLSREKVADGARRRSQHLGSWKMAGIERWRAAIENYVPMVKPGNQTALNSARAPFASYLAAIHNLLHPIFADWFLASLNSLPNNHPMSQDISTNLEIVLDQAEGRVVTMGVTKTSGVTAFDFQALESVQRASPFGPPPQEIVSPDGNVYLHWEFHRDPRIACTTDNARPYILKVKQQPAPSPKPEPTPPAERHGARDASPGSRTARAK